jgi:hypothetical protein
MAVTAVDQNILHRPTKRLAVTSKFLSVEELRGRRDGRRMHISVTIVEKLRYRGEYRRPRSSERDDLWSPVDRDAMPRGEPCALVADIARHVAEPVQEHGAQTAVLYAALTSGSWSVSCTSATGMSPARPPACSKAVQSVCQGRACGSGSGMRPSVGSADGRFPDSVGNGAGGGYPHRRDAARTSRPADQGT